MRRRKLPYPNEGVEITQRRFEMYGEFSVCVGFNLINLKSGVIHRVHKIIIMTTGPATYEPRAFVNAFCGFQSFHNMRLTDKPVTCKTCIKRRK